MGNKASSPASAAIAADAAVARFSPAERQA
jgi:hypothetical protein